MFCGFDLELEKVDFGLSDEFELHLKHGRAGFKKNFEEMRIELDKALKPNGRLDFKRLQESWFPLNKFHIFISHSHKNESLAIALGSWLEINFGLTSFIDSTIWGHSTALLRAIDDEFCVNRNEKSKTYDYGRRNKSTSHVHMMLANCLLQAIDSSECIIVLNTPESITPSSTIQDFSGVTTSPWIFTEITISKFIRKRSPEDHRGMLKKSMTSKLAERLDFESEFPVDLGHLKKINANDLGLWLETFERTGSRSGPHAALNCLYSLNR